MKRFLASLASLRTAAELALLLAFIPTASALAQTAEEEPAVDVEMRFASGLVRLNLPDYAERFINAYLFKHPEAKTKAGPVRIQILTAGGKFDQAEALVKAMPPDSSETLALRLAIADRYYQLNNMKAARGIYDALLKQFTNGPPAEIQGFYAESAYKYAQMQILTGDDAGALQAYRYVLLCKPKPEVERRVQTEMAELCVKVGEKSTGDARKKLFAEAKALCQAVQWKEVDIWFAKTVVILAHIELDDGNKANARKIINDYMPMLKDVDDLLKENKEALRYSPMAECRYVLGTIYEEEGRALMAQKGKEAEAKEQLGQALTHLFTVFVKYPESDWAMDAGKRADALFSFCESKGLKVKRPSGLDMSALIGAQFKDARMLFQQQDYNGASARYVSALNANPDFQGVITTLGELARCYVFLKDPLYASAITGYIADRYAWKTNQIEEAGNALLNVAVAWDSISNRIMSAQTTQLFLDNCPTHSLAAAVVFRAGEAWLRTENYADALADYRQVVEKYPKSRQYVDALSRLAYCSTMLNDHTNAVAWLTKYVKELQPGVDLVSARIRLADEYRLSEQIAPALNDYDAVAQMLTQDAAKYARTSEEQDKNKKSLERAMFFRAFCRSRLQEPDDKTGAVREKSIAEYKTFVDAFPKSDLVPSALSSIGTLYFMQNKPDEAEKTYARLSREYPDSDQAKNVAFAQIRSLLDLGQKEKAVEVFNSRMLANTASFTAVQFLQVGRLMQEAEQYEPAQKAFAKARTAKEAAVSQAASMGLGQALAKLGRFKEAGIVLDELLTKYPNSGYTIEASLLVSRCYAEMGKGETDAGKKNEDYQKSMDAMNTARRLAKDADVMARADLDLAEIQMMMGKKDEAVATYQRLVLLGDAQNAKIRPCIEKAFELVYPLLLERKRYSDILENCEFYLKSFPNGKLVSQAREWRKDAQLKNSAKGTP